MTDSPQRTPYRLPADPITPGLVEETWDSYRRALAEMASAPDGISRLTTLLTDVSARLEAENRTVLSQTLSEYAEQRDRLVLRSTPTAGRSPAPNDRGRPPTSPQPAPWELLSASRRLGPRLAQKLTIAQARREARR